MMSKPLHNFELTSWTLTRSVISRNNRRPQKPVKPAPAPAEHAGANAGAPQLEQCPPPDNRQLQKLCLSVCSFEAQEERTGLDRRDVKKNSASGVAAKKGKEAAAAVLVANQSLKMIHMVSMGEEEQEVKKDGKEKKKRIPDEKAKEEEPKWKGKKVVEKSTIPEGKEKKESKGKQNKEVESRDMENESTLKSMKVRSQDPTEKKNTRGGSTSGPKLDWTSEKLSMSLSRKEIEDDFLVMTGRLPPERNTRGNPGSTSCPKVDSTLEKFSLSLSRNEIEEDFLFMTGRMPPRRPKRRAKKVQKRINKLYKVSLPYSVTVDTYKVIEESAPEEF